MKRYCIALFLLLIAGLTLFGFEHPGGMHSIAQVKFVKQQIKQKNEPYTSAFHQLLNICDTVLLQEHHALVDLNIPGYYNNPADHIKNSSSLAKDAFNAYACALAWQLSDKDIYAKRALYFINAWSSVNKLYSESDGSLVMSYTGTALVMAAELMYHYQGWKNADKQLFSDWLKNVYRKATNEIRTKKNNWADWGRFGSSLSAYYLNDTAEMKENIRLFKSDIFDKIAEDGNMPNETRRGVNGIWYTYFSLAPMTATAWVAYNATGENLFALQKEGRSVKTAVDYLFYYNQHPDEWKWFENPVHGSNDSKFADLDLKTYFSFWPANLIEAMSGIFGEIEYIKYVAPYRPLCFEQHHFAWVFTTLMPARLHGYEIEKNERAFSSGYIKKTMKKVIAWQLKHPKHDLTDWTNGAFYAGVTAAWETTKSKTIYRAIMDMGQANNWKPGKRWYHADDIAICQTYVDMYELKKKQEMIQPFIDTLAVLMKNPYPTKGASVIKWGWCDALFMGPPAIVKLGVVTGTNDYLKFSDQLFKECYDLLYDKEEHLFARDTRYVIKNDGKDIREANGKKIFWSRGNGWVMGGLVRVLQELPSNYAGRDFYINLFKEMSARLIELQQVDGMWRASLLDPESYPGGEVSGTGFDCYAIAWGINNGILDKEKFLPAVEKAWIGLNKCVSKNGHVGWVQPIGGDPKKNFNAESWEVYGTGAYLLAGSEVIKLNK